MKFTYLKNVALIFLCATGLLACSKMNDLHDEYLQRGETIYIGKPDSLKTFAGRERILLRYWSSDPKAVQMTLYWNLRTDSVTFAIPPHAATDSIDVWIPDLAEYNYSFEAVSRNADGSKRSIAYPFSAGAYGPLFQSSLTNRLTDYVRLKSDDGLEIKWFGAIERAVGTEVLYTSTDNQARTRFVPMTEFTTNIPEVKGDVRYRTLFLPEETAIDTFYTDFRVPQIVN